MKKITLVLIALTVWGTGCQTTEDPAVQADKLEVEEGKADGFDVCWWYGLETGCDLCAEFGWYGDGECDQNLIAAGICEGPDPDCGPSFSSFRLFMGGGPPREGIDMSGFIELSADGTLRVDRVGELPSVVHEALVSGADLERAVDILTAAELVELLAADEPPCVEPMDVYESMELGLAGETYQNSVTFCDQAPLVAARDIMHELAANYLPDAGPDFVSFRLFMGGGPPREDMDMSGFIELHADGTLRVDRVGELPAVVHEAVLSSADLERAIAVVADAELVGLLAASEPPCVEPMDVYESMELTLGEETYQNSVTFCDQSAIAAARDIMHELAAGYLAE